MCFSFVLLRQITSFLLNIIVILFILIRKRIWFNVELEYMLCFLELLAQTQIEMNATLLTITYYSWKIST